jgi:hypothetical protein
MSKKPLTKVFQEKLEPPDPPDKNAEVTKTSIGVRAGRKAANVNTLEFIVKASLHKTLVHGTHKEDLIKNINARVAAASKGVHRLSLAIHLLLRTHLSHVKDFRKVSLPNFLSCFSSKSQSENTLFSRHLMLGIKGCRIINPSVKNFLEKYEDELPHAPVRYSGDRNTYNRAAEQYSTNYRTYLETTFNKKQAAFMFMWGARHNIPKNECYMLQFMINGWTNLLKDEKPWMTHNVVKNMITLHREILQLKENINIGPLWWKTHYETVIVYYAMLSNYLTRCGSKGITLAPMCQMKATFIHIDTDVFYGIMNDVGLLTDNWEAFSTLRNERWASILYINKFTTERQRRIGFVFTGTIQTDGVAVCIHYRRPKLQPSKNIFTPHVSDRVIGVDPGRVTMFTGVEKLAGNSKKVYTLSRMQYYHESGITNANIRKDKWNQGIKNALNDLSKYSYKNTSMQSFRGYLQAINRHYDILWDEYLKRRWGRQRLATYSGKKSTMDRFMNSLKDNSGRRVVLAYGDASFGSTGPGELCVPTTSMKRVCEKHFHVVSIDEFRTSQIHHYENKQCAKVYQNGFLVRGLLWCDSTNGSKFVNRDVNAALNMLRCYNAIRPVSLQRTTPKQDKLPNIVLPKKCGAVAKKQRRDPCMIPLWESSPK